MSFKKIKNSTLFNKEPIISINGDEIKHLQYTQFTHGHGSIFGTLNNGKTFKLHLSELLKMMDEFEFNVFEAQGKVIDYALKIDWDSTSKSRKQKDFSFKLDSNEYKKDGNFPNQVNYITRSGKGADTKFTEYRLGPYFSGKMEIIHPNKINKK